MPEPLSLPLLQHATGPLLRNHNLGASFKKGTSFLTQEIFLFMNSFGKLYCLQGIDYGRRPIGIPMVD